MNHRADAMLFCCVHRGHRYLQLPDSYKKVRRNAESLGAAGDQKLVVPAGPAPHSTEKPVDLTPAVNGEKDDE
jgi:hypothetical protein